MKKRITALCAAACSAVLIAAPVQAKQASPIAYSGRVFGKTACPSEFGQEQWAQWEAVLAQLRNRFCTVPNETPPKDCPGNIPSKPETPDNSRPEPTPPPVEDTEEDKDHTGDSSESKPETDGLTAYEAEVVSLVNQERKAAGLSPLTANLEVTKAARIRSEEQTVSFSHTRPNGARFSSVLTEAGIDYQGAGENIAYGQRTSQEVMEGWMNSSGHRANILNPDYTEIGVGCYQDPSGRLYWTQLFIY
ncbi:MAG: CAP domain-containing protein [Provencibacterium sp.]|nr:CAP domain-containing protein [Provencibacterium sp.]